jgi:hypothetical protein
MPMLRSRDLDLETPAMIVLCHRINVTGVGLYGETVPMGTDDLG